MAQDDKETGEAKPRSPLPPHVERALAEARRKSRSGDATPRAAAERPKESRGLALVPLLVCVMLFTLMMPRGADPTEVPLPRIDERALAATVRADRDLAAQARRERLPPEVLAVGSAFRAMQLVDASGGEEEPAIRARTDLNESLKVLRQRSPEMEGLVALRAVQLEGFLDETRRFEATGEITREMQELAGGFVEKMRAVGWAGEKDLVPDEMQLRSAYKLMWNAVVGELTPGLALTLDEQRALYTLYLAHPHAPESRRAELDAERRAAKNEAECLRAAASERRAVEKWRADKIRILGRIDPEFPTDYALGVAYFRGEHYDLAVNSFRAWVEAHPDGPLALRARNHLKAAVTRAATF